MGGRARTMDLVTGTLFFSSPLISHFTQNAASSGLADNKAPVMQATSVCSYVL